MIPARKAVRSQPALATRIPADLLRLSLRFSQRIRSFQAGPWDGRVTGPASFFSRQMISAFGNFVVFRTESRPGNACNRSGVTT